MVIGRPRKTWVRSNKEILAGKRVEWNRLKEMARDRTGWKTLVALTPLRRRGAD